MDEWQLKRTKQCKKCPWKISTNPHEIPNGYCETKHKGLESTIAREGEINFSAPVMACHETDDAYCIGWLVNQIGRGNNIAMRMRMMSCSNAERIELDGEQHQSFEDTLPKHEEHFE